MNIIDREIEKFEEFKEDNELKDGDQVIEIEYNSFINFFCSSLQRVIDETKENCIEALPLCDKCKNIIKDKPKKTFELTTGERVRELEDVVCRLEERIEKIDDKLKEVGKEEYFIPWLPNTLLYFNRKNKKWETKDITQKKKR